MTMTDSPCLIFQRILVKMGNQENFSMKMMGKKVAKYLDETPHSWMLKNKTNEFWYFFEYHFFLVYIINHYLSYSFLHVIQLVLSKKENEQFVEPQCSRVKIGGKFEYRKQRYTLSADRPHPTTLKGNAAALLRASLCSRTSSTNVHHSAHCDHRNVKCPFLKLIWIFCWLC